MLPRSDNSDKRIKGFIIDVLEERESNCVQITWLDSTAKQAIFNLFNYMYNTANLLLLLSLLHLSPLFTSKRIFFKRFFSHLQFQPPPVVTLRFAGNANPRIPSHLPSLPARTRIFFHNIFPLFKQQLLIANSLHTQFRTQISNFQISNRTITTSFF